jgi:hypothetical protein
MTMVRKNIHYLKLSIMKVLVTEVNDYGYAPGLLKDVHIPIALDLIGKNKAIGSGDALQLVYQMTPNGTPVDFVSEFTALKAKLADASSKTQIVSDTGANLLPSGKPILLTGTVTLPADASSYAANDAVNNSASAPVAMAFDVDAAIANGGGGLIGLVKIEAPSQFAGKTINLVVYKDTPSNIPNDNTVFTLTTGNSTKRVAIIPVLMDAQIGASTICFGQASVMIPYQTIASAKTLKGLLFVSDEVTSPTQSGVITVAVTTIQLN